MRQRMRVLERADTHDLTTVDRVRMELGLTEPDSVVDTRLALLITEASSAISGYCDRVFGLERCEETFWPESWGECVDCVVLDRQPLVTIESVLVDDVELGTSDYDVDEEKGIIYFTMGGVQVPRMWWSSIRSSIVVTYTGGYDLMDLLPEAIERACLNMVQAAHFNAGRDTTLRSETIPEVYAYTTGGGGGSSSSQGAMSMPTDIAMLLAPYRHIR